MSPTRLLFMLVCLASCCGSTFGDFFAVAPYEFRPGWPLTIAVTAHKNVNGTIYVNAVLSPANDQIDVYSSVADHVSPGETKLMTMVIPERILVPQSQAILTVKITGAFNHSSYQFLWYNPTSSLVFVETDKAIYKPGQKVQIRVVHVDKDLKPIIKPLTVYIVNPKESKLEEYKDTTSRTGVVDMTYELLQSASLGKWKIQVKDDASMLYTKEFTVEEYVLPKFSVTAKASPGYILLKNIAASSSVTVEALYTYGRGVQGKCHLIVEQPEENIRLEASKQLNEAGKAEFLDLEWNRFARNIMYGEFKVQVTASVTDETGRTEVGQTSVMFYTHNVKVEVLQKTTRVFRLGIPAVIFVRVSDHSGNPIEEAEVELEIKIPGMQNADTKLVVPAGETDVAFHFTPQPQDREQPDYRYRYDPAGTIVAKLKSNNYVMSKLSGYLYQSKNNGFVTVQPAADKMPQVGEPAQYKVVRNPNNVQQTVSYLVVSQGNILEAGAPVDDVISITPTLAMCPSAKLLVYMISGEKKPELVTDVLQLFPTHCFSKEVGVSFDASEIRSGTDTTMKVHVNRLDGSNALPGVHHVYYLGIDKSLVLLQGRTDLNKDEVMSGISNLNLKNRAQEPEGYVPHSTEKMIKDMGLAAFTTASMKHERQREFLQHNFPLQNLPEKRNWLSSPASRRGFGSGTLHHSLHEAREEDLGLAAFTTASMKQERRLKFPLNRVRGKARMVLLASKEGPGFVTLHHSLHEAGEEDLGLAEFTTVSMTQERQRSYSHVGRAWLNSAPAVGKGPGFGTLHHSLHEAGEEDVGLALFTTTHLQEDKDLQEAWDDVVWQNAAGQYYDDLSSPNEAHNHAGRHEEEAEADIIVTKTSPEPINVKVRKNFPETWLWGKAETDMNGHLNQAVTLPDTITTWLVSAFAVNDEGLAVGSGPFELAAFQVFFLTMNLPYSIKRGEVFTLKVTVFNYRSKGVDAVVRLASSSQFSVVDEEEDDNGWVKRSIQMAAGRASSVEFKISATTIGLIELHVLAEDVGDGMRDEVKQKLLVKPEGEMRSRAITNMFFLNSMPSVTDTFVLSWPEDKIVAGSKRVEVKITGVILGQALSNLKHLVSMPFGCGEQNMITTVPNIYGLTYIQATDHQESQADIITEMSKNMKTGYQRQVDKYRHQNGAYSAWGEQDQSSNGSVWLTAFVLKSFSRAATFISVDPTVLSSAAQFLSSAQQSSGAFNETGQVFHSEMQSGTGSGPSLTLYVFISLLEANQAARGDLLNLKQQIDLALGYIQQNLEPADLKKNGNKFLAAMGAYAVSLVPGNELLSLADELLAVVTDKEVPWAETSSPSNLRSYETIHQLSRNIEVASYYLLALTRLKRYQDGLTIIRWLQSQQNSQGGYYSTQDTVMALQALAEFGAAFKGVASASMVNIREPQSGQSFNVSLEGSKAMLLQTVELPDDTKTVEVTVTGPPQGSCIVKVVYTYYTLAGDDDLALDEPQVSVETRTWLLSDNIHNVEACVKSSSSLEYSGMFVTTLTLPSGEEAFDDPSTILATNPRASRVETSQGVIHFYMNEAPREGYCLQAKMERQMKFEVQKPGSAKIYAYYEPGTAQEVALVMDDSQCTNSRCGGTGGLVHNLQNMLLTVIMCVLGTLLVCM